MDTNFPAPPSCQVLEELAERCTRLGIWTFAFDRAGNPLPCPNWNGFNARGFESQLKGIAAGWWADLSQAKAVDLGGGIVLSPVFHPRLSKRHGLMAGMTIDPQAIESGRTNTVLERLEIDPHEEAVAQAIEVAQQGHSEDPDALTRPLQFTFADLAEKERDQKAVEEFSGKLNQTYEELKLLYRLGKVFHDTSDPVHSFSTMREQILAISEFTWVATVFSGRRALSDLTADPGVAGDLPISPTELRHLAEVLLLRHGNEHPWLLLDPERDDLAELVKAEVFSLVITHDQQPVGLLLAGNKVGPDPEASSVERQLLEASAQYMGVFHENASRYVEQKRHFLGTLKALTTAIEAKDPYTCGHSERVGEVAAMLAAAIGWDQAACARLRICGLVHDVGKIGVPETILCKPDRPTKEEFDLIRAHPRIGYQILRDIPAFDEVLDGVLYHHERWDGRGYPDGLAGENIPLIGRIMAVADTFDAMSSARSYRQAIDRDNVLTEIQKCSGSQFDPELIEPFLSLDFAFFDEMLQSRKALLWAA